MDKSKKITTDFKSPLALIKDAFKHIKDTKDFPRTRVCELIDKPMDTNTKKELSQLLFPSTLDIPEEFTIKYKLLERSKKLFTAEEYNMLVRTITKQKLSK